LLLSFHEFFGPILGTKVLMTVFSLPGHLRKSQKWEKFAAQQALKIDGFA
jgi:hypothetical protein